MMETELSETVMMAEMTMSNISTNYLSIASWIE